eukprot:TRINITY_DN85324_c0_g1_i1.p2 TRINITY_DN85324_c0_g1~~TRINITY_DN85324_c0_g1_i1.p2  ORF type:complete len:172 (+),score=45.24 TRINITY_DN85324_c0_g1_i1:26-517(+)
MTPRKSLALLLLATAAIATTANLQPEQSTLVLNEAQGESFRVDSGKVWNDSGFTLQQGAKYLVTATGQWDDQQYKSGPDGYDAPWILRKLGWLKRMPAEKYFALICCYGGKQGEGKESERCWKAGSKVEFVAERTAEMSCFANDVKGFYWNNHGALEVKIVKE